MTTLDIEHRRTLDGIRYSIQGITTELVDWADNAYANHGHDSDDPDPIMLAIHLKVLTELARDAAQARDHLAALMATDVRRNPATFAEPIEGIGLLKVGADSVRHDYDSAALASKVAQRLQADEDGQPLTAEEAVTKALRCTTGWRVRDLAAIGVDAKDYRSSTYGTPKTRIEAETR